MEPLISVEPGESFELETWDPFKGQIFEHGMGDFTTEDIPLLNSPPSGFDTNPVSGPVYIDGVESGDTSQFTLRRSSPSVGPLQHSRVSGIYPAREPGDDRKAIDILRHAGEVVNGESANTIGEELVCQA